jgi:hypothetical protein
MANPIVALAGIVKLSVISEKERYRVGGRQPLGVKTSAQVGDQQAIDGQNTIPVEAFWGLPSSHENSRYGCFHTVGWRSRLHGRLT